VIATFGDAPCLGAVLAKLRIQTLKDFEVLIVDNNSRQKWPQDLLAAVPGKVQHEPSLGLSAARNTGLMAASGKYVAFLDDDALPEPNWFERLVSGIEKYNAVGCGGSVKLIVDKSNRYGNILVVRRLLSELVYNQIDIPKLREDQYIVGANMCFRREALIAVGGFDVHFGRVGRNLLSSEELDLCRRLQLAGEIISFVADAVVQHQIASSRLELGYILSRAYWQGRSDALLEGVHGRPLFFGTRSPWKNIWILARSVDRWMRSPREVILSIGLVRELGFCQGYGLWGRPRI
jgi:GT2 family glycosyltransferase